MKVIKGPVKVSLLPSVKVPSRRMGDQERYGVGEELRLVALQSLPTGRGPTATWVIVSGGGTMRNTGNNTATYTAPDLGQAQLLSGHRTFKVVLELRDPKGELAQIELEIVSPDLAGLVKLGGRHQSGVANSGFWGQVLIGPNDVSFMRILMKETRGTWNGTGTLSTWSGLLHQDSGAWVAASKMRADGTLMDAVDRVWTQSPKMTAPDGSVLPWKAAGAAMVGEATWDIAWMYKLVGDPSATGLQFHKAWHKTKVQETGLVRVDKGGASHQNLPGDANENWADVCPLPKL